jgi:hypothetical protein
MKQATLVPIENSNADVTPALAIIPSTNDINGIANRLQSVPPIE